MWIFNVITSININYKNNHKNIYKINIYKINKKNINKNIYGGGNSLLLDLNILEQYIIKYFLKNNLPIIYLSPQGKILNQNILKKLIYVKGGINLLCCKNEGIDERIINKYKIYKISIGNYIISSGNIAATIFIDSIIRILIGNKKSKSFINEESLGKYQYKNLIECPQYTKPFLWKKKIVPAILNSGNHNIIKEWKLIKSIKYTLITKYKIWKKNKK